MAQHADTMAPDDGAAGREDAEFFRHIRETLPDVPADEAADAVLCALAERVSGGVAARLLDDLPESLRTMVRPCSQHLDAPPGNADDFDTAVANHLGVEEGDVRRVLSAVFAALEGEITKETADEIERQLPAGISSTWAAARRRVSGIH